MKVLFIHLFLFLMYAHRELIIFYHQDGIAIKNKQVAGLEKAKKGIEERDIIINTFQTNVSTATVKKYHIDTSKIFTIILVGRDGGEKLRSDTVLTTTTIFSIIDAMPMRRAEMKNE